MHPANGLNFHPEVRDRVGTPRRHLRLAVRAHHLGGYCIRGECEIKIGPHHRTARECLAAIRSFCGAGNHCWATVKIYWEDGTLWDTREIGKPERILP